MKIAKLFSLHSYRTQAKYIVFGFIPIIILLYFFICPFRSILPWSLQRDIEILGKIPISNIKLCVCTPTKTHVLPSPDGLKIVIDEYLPTNKQIIGNIIIIHGHTDLGGRLGIYRILAKNLAAAGFATYVPDLPGFGRSDDPFTLRHDQPRDNTEDVITVTQYVQHQNLSNNKMTSIIGHSRGSTYILKAFPNLKDISSIVLIGPPRRVSSLAQKPKSVEKAWRRSQDTRKKVYGKDFPDWYSRTKWRKNFLDMDITKHLSPFKLPNHIPLTFIEGESEPKKDRDYTKSVVNTLNAPISYHLIKDADHYINTIHFGSVVIYDSQKIKETIKYISEFLPKDT